LAWIVASSRAVVGSWVAPMAAGAAAAVGAMVVAAEATVAPVAPEMASDVTRAIDQVVVLRT
jgi:hypothetical protein